MAFKIESFQQSIKDYAATGDATADKAKDFFQTPYAYIHDDGDVWVGTDGRNGRILSEKELRQFVEFIEAGFPQ